MGELVMPRCLVAAARAEGRDGWLDSVSDVVARFADEWSLTIGPPYQPGGHTAWVAPARGPHGADVVLKVGWRHPEADHEADALRLWAGTGAVLVHDSAELDDTIVLLLERCVPGNALSERPEPAQDDVIADLLPRLWISPPAGHPFRPLAQMCAQWADSFDRKREAGAVPLDDVLATEGIALFRSLPETADESVLLCTDLHAGNVLGAGREPWLVVDPKPYVGDRTYDVLQHLLNCPSRLQEDPLALVRNFADRLDLDRDRLRLWLLARCVQESPDSPELADVARRLAAG